MKLCVYYKSFVIKFKSYDYHNLKISTPKSWLFICGHFSLLPTVQLKGIKTKQFFTYLRLKIMYWLENTKKWKTREKKLYKFMGSRSIHRQSIHRQSIHRQSIHRQSIHWQSIHRQSIHRQSFRRQISLTERWLTE